MLDTPELYVDSGRVERFLMRIVSMDLLFVRGFHQVQCVTSNFRGVSAFVLGSFIDPAFRRNPSSVLLHFCLSTCSTAL